MELKSHLTHDINEINNICVVIDEVSPNQFHTGFFFRTVDGEVKFLHLQWFEKLTYEAPDINYKWLDIPFDEFNLMHFQVFLETIFKKNGESVPYGLAIDGIDFGNDGQMLQEEEYSGLTCATFVLRVLHSQGYKIIDLDNWEVRQEDQSWQSEILKALNNYWKTSESFITHQSQYIGKVARYKPQEVMVAAASENPPESQEKIIKLAEELVDKYFK